MRFPRARITPQSKAGIRAKVRRDRAQATTAKRPTPTKKPGTFAATLAAIALQPCLVDCYGLDGVGLAQLAALLAAGWPWAGIILQCSNGLGVAGSVDWFPSMWKAARATPRYGTDWLRAAYQYHRVGVDPVKQADFALDIIDKAGGWGVGDLWFAIDIERGQQPAGATAAQVEDSVSRCAERVLSRTGRAAMLYAGSYTRDLGITSRMGCSLLWFPEWDGQLSWPTVGRMGFDINSTELWQVRGDKPATVPGYPTDSPIPGQDYSIMVRGNLPAAQGLAWTLARNGANPR